MCRTSELTKSTIAPFDGELARSTIAVSPSFLAGPPLLASFNGELARSTIAAAASPSFLAGLPLLSRFDGELAKSTMAALAFFLAGLPLLTTLDAINWFFLGGAIAPILVWLATKAFPQQEWIRLINMPVLIGATGSMPPATAVNYTSWIVVGFLLDLLYIVLIYFCLNLEEVKLEWWGNDLDGCLLASCPSAKGVVVDGCPGFY
uniref:Uncharacterized protein n=1 Tax=Fagus sylvatica TaxID=28930 RepID=A0A2N9F432_FAGSY